MIYERMPVILSKEQYFNHVLDTACERLQEKHIEFSIQRLNEMDEELKKLEKELDEFLNKFRI